MADFASMKICIFRGNPVFESSENFFFVRLPNLNAKKKAGDDEINDEIKRISAA